MSKPKATYHHGDLRQALIHAGVAVLAEEGMHALSLRKLARQVGVSHNAPYQHFADKDALLAAIATEGFVMLTAALDAALTAARATPLEQLQATRVYVQFALAHPHHMQVMFHHLEHQAYPELQAAAMQAFDQLVTIIARGQHQGLFISAPPAQLAGMVWVFLHGLAALLIADKVPERMLSQATPEELTRIYLHWLFTGIQCMPNHDRS
jgi:AcrR family transcriptional regulator